MVLDRLPKSSSPPHAWRRREVVLAALDLGVFVVAVSEIVRLMHGPTHGTIVDFVAALHFTVAAATTTGHGGVPLEGASGRLLSVVIPVVGVALSLRLARAWFRPRKVRFPCPGCGRRHHDPEPSTARDAAVRSTGSMDAPGSGVCSSGSNRPQETDRCPRRWSRYRINRHNPRIGSPMASRGS
jgi:hypothetical protein